MRDLQAIAEACRASAKSGQALALATVVKVEGSAYRRPGARMLVYQDGRRLGSISGGCLEADVVLRAHQVMATGQPHYVLYDTRVANGDLIVELGCKGAVGILIEPTSDAAVLGGIEFLASFARARGQGAMATIFRVEGNCPVSVGSRFTQRQGEAVRGDLALPELVSALGADMAYVQQRGQAMGRTYPLEEGVVEALIEPVQSPISLLLCGAGQDAIPLAQMARLLGWQVTVLDHRPSMLSPERFPGIETLLVTPKERLASLPDTRTAAVIMTHSYAHDLAWLEYLLPSPLRYIGLLGPHRRAEQIRLDLQSEGIVVDEARLHSPVGLDIGTETSEEIALAILAEIQAVLTGRPGGFLRERKGPIHESFLSAVKVTRESAVQDIACPLSG